MSCDTRALKGQSLTERKKEVLDAVQKLSKLLVAGAVRPVIGPTGEIAFAGWSETDRGRTSDACAYRRLMATGSPTAIAAIQRAEQMAGRTVDRATVAHGAHSHDNGRTWHDHKG